MGTFDRVGEAAQVPFAGGRDLDYVAVPIDLGPEAARELSDALAGLGGNES